MPIYDKKKTLQKALVEGTYLNIIKAIYDKPMEKAMAPHSSTLAWKIPWMEESGRLQSMGSLRVRYNWLTSLSLFTFHFHALEKEMATHSRILAWNPMDRRAWQATVHGVTKSQTRLNTHALTLTYIPEIWHLGIYHQEMKALCIQKLVQECWW